MNEEIFKQYAKLEDKKREIEEKQEELKGMIFSEMQKEKFDTVKSEKGTFSLVKRTTWTYSQKIKDLEESIKEKKAKEQENKIAIPKESVSLSFRPSQTNK